MNMDTLHLDTVSLALRDRMYVFISLLDKRIKFYTVAMLPREIFLHLACWADLSSENIAPQRRRIALSRSPTAPSTNHSMIPTSNHHNHKQSNTPVASSNEHQHQPTSPPGASRQQVEGIVTTPLPANTRAAGNRRPPPPLSSRLSEVKSSTMRGVKDVLRQLQHELDECGELRSTRCSFVTLALGFVLQVVEVFNSKQGFGIFVFLCL